MEQWMFLLFLNFVFALTTPNVSESISELPFTLPSTTTSFEIKETTKALEKSTQQTQNLTNSEQLLKLETVLPIEPSTKQPLQTSPPTTTSTPKINSNTEHADEVEFGETISFGIRSFTVEVSTNDNKVSTTATTTSVKEMTTIETTKLPETTTPAAAAAATSADETLSSAIVLKVEKTSSASTTTTTTSALTSEASAPTTAADATTTTVTITTTADIVKAKIDETHLTQSKVVEEEEEEEADVLKSNLNILFNDGDSETTVIDEMRFNKPSEPEIEENEISNEIQIDKKLDNGLYRIKIGEITTDEFNNGLSFNDPNDDDNDERDVERQIKNKFSTVIPTQHHEHEHEHYVQPKVNIDDFFPSKMEDFKPIIEISNEKMLKQKNALHDDEVKHVTDIMFNDGKIKIATTNIEIDLIEDSSTVMDTKENQQDDTVNTNMEDVPTTTTTLKAPKINTDNLFIPRRAKKSDQLIKSGLTQGPTRIHDFGMTKFHQDLNNKTHNVKNQTVNGKPEFSTTKFYNSKELYSEILHKALKPSTVTPSPKAPMNANNLIREKILITNRIPVEVINVATTMEPTTTLKTTITSTVSAIVMPTSHLRVLSRLEEKINSLDCDIQNLSILDTNVWRGNETHELNLPITVSDFTDFYFFFC